MMIEGRQRIFRLAIALVMTMLIVILAPSPEMGMNVFLVFWVGMVSFLWSGLVLDAIVLLFKTLTARAERQASLLSLSIMLLGLTIIGFIWSFLAAGLGFWPSVFAMVPVYMAYSLVAWIIRHRDDFDRDKLS